MQIVGAGFNAEFVPGIGIERFSVGMHTFNESNRTGDWLKHWVMLQKFVALNKMNRKTFEKHVTCRTLKRCRDAVGRHLGEQKILEMQ